MNTRAHGQNAHLHKDTVTKSLLATETKITQAASRQEYHLDPDTVHSHKQRRRQIVLYLYAPLCPLSLSL